MKNILKLKIMGRMLGVFTFGIFLVSFGSADVSAYPVDESVDYSIGVNPAKLDFEIKPGMEYNGEYKIFNRGAKAYTAKIIITPHSVVNDTYEQDFVTESKYNSIRDWVKLERDSFYLESGAEALVKFHISVPKDAKGGGQYMSFVNRIDPGKASGVTAVKQIGLIAAVKVNGEGINLCGNVIEHRVSWWQSSSPLESSAHIENCGNIDFDATGKIKVENWLGGGVLYESPKPGTLYLRPETTRRMQLDWEGAPIFGLFLVTQDITVGDETFSVRKFVILCPVWLSVCIIAAVLLIITAVFGKRIFKNKKKRM
jgi:hypothetical protein